VKKEIDTYKIDRLIEVLEQAILWGWYLSGAIIGACLWFFHLPETRVQTFAFAAVFVWYSVVSTALTKVKQIRLELK
jgi:uncharacterized membrane protein YbjE (DUF340 family)